MEFLHRFEALELPARRRRILTPGLQRKNNRALLGDQREAEADRLLGLIEALLQEIPIHA